MFHLAAACGSEHYINWYGKHRIDISNHKCLFNRKSLPWFFSYLNAPWRPPTYRTIWGLSGSFPLLISYGMHLSGSPQPRKRNLQKAPPPLHRICVFTLPTSADLHGNSSQSTKFTNTETTNCRGKKANMILYTSKRGLVGPAECSWSEPCCYGRMALTTTKAWHTHNKTCSAELDPIISQVLAPPGLMVQWHSEDREHEAT